MPVGPDFATVLRKDGRVGDAAVPARIVRGHQHSNAANVRASIPTLQKSEQKRCLYGRRYVRDQLDGLAVALRHPQVYAFLHVPVQSGSDNVLGRQGMNRESPRPRRKRPVATEYPRRWPRRRRDPSRRNIHVVAAASPRPVATEWPRRRRGVAATRRDGMATGTTSRTSAKSRTA